MTLWTRFWNSINRYQSGIIAVIVFYTITLIGQSLLGWLRHTQAEQPLATHRLVAILVQESLLDDIQEELERYTKTYMPTQIDNVMPLVISVYPDYTPYQIHNTLENLYYEGLIDKPSTLEGIVAIGDIPLPTVWDQENSYQTIFPYVDFDKSAYRRSPTKERFESTDQVSHPQAELWHGLLPLGDNPQPYRDYFAKLQKYAAAPSGFVDKRIRVDDFTALNSAIDPEKIGYYLNASIFAEDLNYHRYSPLLFELLQGVHNDRVDAALSSLSDIQPLPLVGDGSDEFIGGLNDYTNSLSNLMSTHQNQNNAGKGSDIPTLMIQKSIQELLLSYPELLSQGYRADLEEMWKAGGRWTGDQIDNHMQKLFLMDSVVNGTTNTPGVMTRANTLLESAMINIVKDNKYQVPYPLFVQAQRGNKDLCSSIIREAMYHGRNGREVNSVSDLSIYQGTFGNHATIGSGYLIGDARSSIGASQGVFDTQIAANRGYNTMNKFDVEIINSINDIDKRRCENIGFQRFIEKYWGGNSIVNLKKNEDGTFELGEHDVKRAWDPYHGYKNIFIPEKSSHLKMAGPVFDQAGSKRTQTNYPLAGSYSIADDISIQQVTRNRTKTRLTNSVVTRVPFCSDERFSWSQLERSHDFFDAWRGGTPLRVNQKNRGAYDECSSQSRYYIYKLLDSTHINASPTPEQVAAMNITTPDRPIDSDHTITFQGLGATPVTLTMPNMRDVAVFQTSGTGDQQTAELLSISEIEQNIRTYLADLVTSYNTILIEQNQLAESTYKQYQTAYDFLATVDPQATVNRSYQLLSDNFLEEILGEDYLRQVAAALRWQNLPRKEIERSQVLKEDLDSIRQSTQIDSKIAQIMDSYLNEDPQNVLMPGYQTGGYESVILHMDSNSTAVIESSPSWDVADRIRNNTRRARLKGVQDTGTKTDEKLFKDAELCGYVAGNPVPLFGDRMDALGCRREVTKTKPFDVKITLPSIDERAAQQRDNIKNTREAYGESFRNQQESIQTLSQMISNEDDNNRAVLEDLPALRRPGLRRAYHQISLDWSNTAKTIDELDNISLKIQSSEPLDDDIVLSLTTTGVQCVMLDGRDTCTGALTIDPSSIKNSRIFTPSFENYQAGMVAASLSLCDATDTSVCLTKSSVLTLMPGVVTDAEISLPSGTIAAGSLMPVRIVAVDKGGNRAGTQPSPLIISSLRSGFENGPQITNNVQTQTPHQSLWRYRAPVSSLGVGASTTNSREQRSEPQLTFDTLTLAQSGGTSTLTREERSIISVPANIQTNIIYQGENNQNPSISLDPAMDSDDITTLPQLVVTVRDQKGELLPNQLIHISTNAVYAHLIDTEGESLSTHMTDNNGQVVVGVVPHGAVGESTITTRLYGSEQLIQNTITWKPGPPQQLSLISPDERLQSGDTTRVDIKVADSRGHEIADDTLVRISIRGPLTISGAQNILTLPVSSFPLTLTASSQGRATMVAMIQDVDIQEQIADIHERTIAEDLVDLDNMNALTLYLDGRGRGNRFSEDGKDRIQKAFQTSDKLLAVSTTTMPAEYIGSGDYIIPWSTKTMPGDSITHAFMDDGTPLTDRGQDASWGEAHRSYANPLMIVYGDPLLRHTGNQDPIQAQHTDQRGLRIFTDADKVIAQTIPFDFNADELEDLLIVYTDGSIHLLKNYGGEGNPYVDLGMLILVESSIHKVIAGDIDGDEYDDIVVWTKDNQLRAYKNTQGIIDVDGYPICLPVSGGPDRLEGVHQLFMHDMDRDGALDIITNDTEGVISIIYGGEDAAYLSRDRFSCDSERKQRTTQERTVVTQLGVELTTDPVYDSSLIHRDGLTYTSNEVTGSPEPFDNSSDLVGPNGVNHQVLNDLISNQMTVNTDELIANSVGEAYRFIASPIRFVPPHYGQSMKQSDMYYVPAYSQHKNDPVTIQKFYNDHNGGLLLPGDKVTVTVRAQAHQQTLLTYLDYGRGAREVQKTTDNNHIVVGQVIDSFDRTQINSDAVYRDEPTPDYLYMIDNLSFQEGQTREWSYDLIYAGGPLAEIDIRAFDDDEYLDIIIAPTDSCRQIRQEWINEAIGKKRSYKGSITDLAAEQHKLTQQGSKEMNEANELIANDTENTMVENDINNLGIFSQIGEARLQDFFSDYAQGGSFRENFDKSLGNGGPTFSSSINLNINVDPEIMAVYENIVQGLCQGFGVGEGCGGLPVPFNMAFLAPGDYQVMGCKIFQDKGLPIFFFPGTLPTPLGPVPIPYGLKGAADEFYRAPGGTYSSLIRVYVAPTLTQQVGVAICMGPQNTALKLPAPFKDIAGNCIVTAVGIDKSCKNSINKNIRPDGPNSLGQDRYDIAQRGTCSNPAAQAAAMNDSQLATTPFLEAARDTIINTRKSPGFDHNGYPPASSLQGGDMLGGLLYLDQQPTTVSLASESGGDTGVALKPGIDIKNQIKGGKGSGLAQCLVKGRLDPQITYIANNLTTLNLTVYLPDVSGIVQGLDTLTPQTIANIRKQDTTKNPSKTTVDKKNTTTLSEAIGTTHNEKLIDSLFVQRGQIEKLRPLENPFTKLEKVFEEVPLISISKKSVSINVPLITDEDITAYESSIKERITHNKKIAKEWEDLAEAIFGICGQAAKISLDDETTLEQKVDQTQEMIGALTEVKNTSTDDETIAIASECLDILVNGKIEGMISFQQDMSQMMQMVQSNMQALRTYKEFPSQLASLLGSVDRYVADAAVFVTSIFGTINERLSTNARIFNSYVDAIVSMKIAVETRQALIDLSVNRKQSCSTCSNDNYGSYSCNLSFMCPSNLPILKFPPLKIPDIYIDLSHIDAGVELMLPEIKFISQSVDLPTLPNIPQPPVIEVDIGAGDWGDIALEEILSLMGIAANIPSLPQLPILPSAPDLPELPPIIPKVDLSLPYLPPPPEIPSLSPSIQQMITVGENIGKLFCIMKGEIGFVSEGGVKAKIEQLTQRTRNVPIFDYFNLTQAYDTPTLQGMDFRVDSSIDFSMNINALYSILNSVVGVANEFTDKVRTGSEMRLQDQSNSIQNHINRGLDLPNVRLQGKIPETDRDDLMTSLDLIQNEYQTPSRDIQALQRLITDRQNAEPAYFDNHERAKKKSTILASLDDYRANLTTIHQEIHNESMNSVLALLDDENIIPVHEQRFVTHLVVPEEMDKVRALDPMQDYMTTSHAIIQSYEHDLTHQSANDLHLTQDSYNQLRLQTMQTKALASGLLTAGDDRPGFSPLEGRRAQVDGGVATAGAVSYDFSQYLQGTYFMSGSTAYDVIKSDYWEKQITDTLQYDLNHDGEDDMLLRDEHSIYIKYASRNSIHKPHFLHGNEGDVRYIDMGSAMTKTDEYGGYKSSHNDRFRVGSALPAVQNIQTDGQTYDTVRYSWDDSAVFGREYDGYLVRLSKRVDIHHDSAHQDITNPPLDEIYVLVIGTDRIVPEFIRLDHNTSYQRTQDLIDQGVLTIQETQLPTQRVAVALDEISRHWHYAQVAHMRASETESRAGAQKAVPRLTIASPWSSQAVAGPQILADDDAPLPTVTLHRERKDSQVVGSGLDLHGNIGTYYTLDIQRDDPSGTASNRIRRPDGVSRDFEGDHAAWSGLFFTGIQQYQITIGADDTQNNTAERLVVLTIDSPNIQVIDVASDGEMGTVVSELSQDIDEGVVQFDRQSGSADRSILSGTWGDSFPVTTDQTIITGGLYTIGDMIGLYDDSDTQIGSLNPHTGELALLPRYKDQYEIKGERRDHYLRRVVSKKSDHSSLFAITLPIRSITMQTSLHPSYTRKDVDIGPFSECLTYQDECIIARDDAGHLVIPAPYNYAYYATYTYVENIIQTTIVRQSDEMPVARIYMEPDDLLPSDR